MALCDHSLHTKCEDRCAAWSRITHCEQFNSKLVMEGVSDQCSANERETMAPTKVSTDIAGRYDDPSLTVTLGRNNVTIKEEFAYLI